MRLSAKVFLLFFLSDLMAGTTGKISGIITDQDTDDKLIGVNVVIRESHLGAASDADGFYFIPNIPPGNYSITASMIGYTTITISNVIVNIDKTTTIHFKMQPTVLEGQAIEIVAERPVVQKDNTSTIQFVDAEDLKIMPVNNFERLVSLSAGATTDFRGMHLRGGRVSETIYEIDGLPVQDVHFGYQGITVPSVAISEVSIMTGGFSAEYGNAQSGVVNIVTREGGEKYEGMFEAQLAVPVEGDKYRTDYRRWVGSASGPFPFTKRFRFFFSGEIITAQDGYPGITRVDQPVEIYNINGKLSYVNAKQNIQLTLGAVYNYNQITRYLIEYSLLPQNFPEGLTKTQQYSLKFTHFLNKNIFYDISAGYYYRQYTERQPGKWWDISQSEDWNSIDISDSTDTWGSSYAINNITVRPEYLELNSDYTGFFDQQTKISTLKGNLNLIIGKNHTVKAGFESSLYDLNYFTVWGIYGAPYTFIYGNQQLLIENGQLERKTTPDWLGLEPVRPKILGIYLQDKMEYSGMIMNLGLRLDIFDPAASKPKDLWYAFYPADDTLHYPANPAPWTYGGIDYDIPTLRETEKASIKYYLSPRLGVSYPIMERDVMHFSYGHFVQIPQFYNLYSNQNFSYDYWYIVGNPDLEWEQTISYEVGVAHAFSRSLALNVTAFYKDINNLTNIKNFADPTDPNQPEDDPNNPDDDLVDTPVGIQTYINEDWGNVRGFELSIQKRPVGKRSFSGYLSYTYMLAKGRYSDPRDGMLRRSNQILPSTKYYPLDWDMRHRLVANIDYRLRGNYGINLLLNYSSPLPYTGPQTSIQWEYNDQRLPDILRLDLKLNKVIPVKGKMYFDLYLQVLNLLDRENLTRFNDESTYVPIVQYLEEHPGDWGGPLNNPLVYDTHREFRAGLVFNF
jgi:outer membrane receptor protein involved in Fe transport